FNGLSEEELNWKPSPGVWSIAENIVHLKQVNESYFPGFCKLKKGDYNVPFTARFGFVVRFFGNMILKSVQPENKKKVKTFPIWNPKKSTYPKAILQDFRDHQDRLKEEMNSLLDQVKENSIISSPVNRNLVYRLQTAFDIIVAHEERHYNQASELCDLLKNENKSSN
ncbi:MAG: DinB family protein, partial [Gramella sp.]|nr:DinB family protein [Christiangramia sp.]